MTRIQIFTASRPDNQAGADDDVAVIEWARSRGATIELLDLANEPAAFDGNRVVSGFLARSGREALPLVLVDGEISLTGRFPSQDDCACWLGVMPTLQPVKKQSECCGGCC